MAEQIIVVGAGIIGAAIAFRLAERGAAVTVIDRALPAAGASGNSFGWINANFAETAEYYRLRRSSIDAFRALAGQLDLADHLRWEGCLWWEDEGDDLVRHAGELAGFGYEASVIGAAQFAQLEPHVANPPVASIRSTIEGAADAAAITRRLLAEAARHGASIVTGCEMQGLTMPGGRVTGVATSLGAMRADRVVIAAGAATGALLDRDGIALPMANKPGIILHTAPVAPLIRHIIMSPDVHFHQRRDGSLVIGEIFSGGGLNAADESPVAFADRIRMRLQDRLPDAGALTISQVLLGTRPVPADGLPVLGHAPGHANLYLAVTHSGVTLAPLIADLCVMETLDASNSPLLNSFRPARFQ